MSYPGPMHPHALVLEDFNAEASTELTVKKGEHVFLIWTFNSGWYVCNSRDAFGCVPSQFLKEDGYGQLKAGAPAIDFLKTKDEVMSSSTSEGRDENSKTPSRARTTSTAAPTVAARMRLTRRVRMSRRRSDE
ncbi:hypothetical protein F5Y13DRAFT_192591 [Hypoxylon sp. FL1857]|nr:hypothetical protein F5Y13DRAFT_192591 [Hypoxylon sp. FL1857]